MIDGARCFLDEFMSVGGAGESGAAAAVGRAMLRWMTPVERKFKVNTDAAYGKGANEISCGHVRAVIRDCRGAIVAVVVLHYRNIYDASFLRCLVFCLELSL